MWPTSGKGQLFFDDILTSPEKLLLWMAAYISYIKQKFKAYTLIWLHHKRKFRFY